MGALQVAIVARRGGIGSERQSRSAIRNPGKRVCGQMAEEADVPRIEQNRRGDRAAVIHHAGAPNEIARADDAGFTPLMTASGLGQSRLVEGMLGAGADVHALEPRMGLTALHLAAQSGNPDVISLLLDHGAIIDQPSATLGHTALMDALLHKHEAAVRVLLERGAKTTVRTHYGMTAADIGCAEGLVRISLACLHGFGDLAQALCGAGRSNEAEAFARGALARPQRKPPTWQCKTS